MKKLIILGASGSSLDILSIVNYINKNSKTFEFIGFLDDNPEKVHEKYKKKILGKFKDALSFKNVYFSIGTGNEKNFLNRKNVIKNLNIPIEKFANIIHPTSIIDENTYIGHGNIIHAYVSISRDVRINDFVNILPKTTINHDVNVGSFTIINSNTTISGNVVIGDCCYLGQGSNIRDHIVINNEILIGMGSVVTKDLKKSGTYYGVPAKLIRK